MWLEAHLKNRTIKDEMDCMEFDDRRVGSNINTLGRITDCCVRHTQHGKNVTSFVSLDLYVYCISSCAWTQCWISLTCRGLTGTEKKQSINVLYSVMCVIFTTTLVYVYWFSCIKIDKFIAWNSISRRVGYKLTMSCRRNNKLWSLAYLVWKKGYESC